MSEQDDGMIGERVDETQWPEKPGPGDNYWCCGECHRWWCEGCGEYHCNWFEHECPKGHERQKQEAV